MKKKLKAWTKLIVIGILVTFMLNNCSSSNKESTGQSEQEHLYPSDVLPFMDQWKILLGDGTSTDDLVNYEASDFFYVATEDQTNWVVYKTPNSGVTSRTSSNTRTELGQKAHWLPQTGGKLNGTLKVMHVSTTLHYGGCKSCGFLFSSGRTDS